MKLSDTITIPLRESYICGDMETPHISTNPHRCPVCFSQVTHLGKLLDRERQEGQ